MITARFPLGRLMITANAQAVLHPGDVFAAIDRHANGDWGDICEEDRQENERALGQRLRLLSVYTDSDDTRFWIITEADRSLTTVLLPDDY
jgi:hypothetical protein